MKKFTIFNHTSDIVRCCDQAGETSEYQFVFPSASMTSTVSKAGPISLTLTSQPWTNHLSVDEKELQQAHTKPDAPGSFGVNVFTVNVPIALGATWKVVEMPSHCPWRIYRSKISKRHHKLSIFPRRELSSFLAEIPDTVPLSALMLPGTHDALAFYGWPISQCQSLATPLSVQLHTGIRVIDIRLAVKDSRLISYHGSFPQRTPFQEILTTIHDFLTAPQTCRETIVMSIKQEDFSTTPPPIFSQLVHSEIESSPGGMGMWFLENRIPRLGEVRGRVVMFSRFGGDGSGWEHGLEGLGIHPTAWPDSEKSGFIWQCKETLVRTHDWYNIPSFLSIPEKAALSSEILIAPQGDLPNPILSISYFSAASFPLAFPPTVARGFGWPAFGFGVEGVNARAVKWLLDTLGDQQNNDVRVNAPEKEEGELRIRGWVLMDFYTDPTDNALVPLLVECNFRGRSTGEEGWL